MTTIRKSLLVITPFNDDGQEPMFITMERENYDGGFEYITTIVSDSPPDVEFMGEDDDRTDDEPEGKVVTFTPKGKPTG